MWQCATCGAQHDARPRPGHGGGIVSQRDEFWIGKQRMCCMDSFAKACRVNLAGAMP